jgi:hypothetical protein
MIKFFRKIRHNLIKKNKTGKYLKYAIGEIVLVMIGILLALQVNDWNNEKNRNNKEIVIKEQLIVDLVTSKIQLEKLIEAQEKRAEASAIICHSFWKNKTPHDSIIDYMRMPLGNTVYSPVLGTAKSLINSGNLSVIKSNKLKNAITAYVERIENNLKDISRYEETYYRRGIESINEVIPVTSLGSKSLLNDYIKKSSSPTFETSRNDKYSARPNVIEKIPFETDLKQLFQNKRVYSAYSFLLIAHRNVGFRYNEILENINELLKKLE